MFSLEELRKITEDGVMFQSYLDGSKHFFSPERSLEVQHSLGADIIMAFDECPPFPCTEEATRGATERTHRWLERCVSYHASQGTNQLLFGIAQGGTYEHLRVESAQFVASMDTPGDRGRGRVGRRVAGTDAGGGRVERAASAGA